MPTPPKDDNRPAEYLHVLQNSETNLPKVIEILWMDAAGTGLDWETAEETSAYKPEPTTTVGYLWEQTDEHIIVVSVINTMHTTQGMVIPTGCIQWIRTIR